MLYSIMKCIYCDHPYTYELSDKQRKCSKCKRKFSPRKVAREKKLLELFTQGVNASKSSKQTKMHFLTVQKYYDKFRKNIALYADEMYQYNAQRVTEYDEYLYLPKSLNIDENIDKLQHFLTMSYEQTIYNIMMPKASRSLLEYKDESSKKLMIKYLKFNKIAKLCNSQNNITRFWTYFEDFILQYKGVSDEQFIFYLKEAEWRFNSKFK
ncbi:MAG: transposase [Arcobacter sp.]|nr:MAG: transposase [Arcobacter sp.]